MNEHDIEQLLQEFEGPTPSEGLLEKIKNKARVPEAVSKTAATSKAKYFRPRVMITAASVLLAGLLLAVILMETRPDRPVAKEISAAGTLNMGTVTVIREDQESILEKGSEYFPGDSFLPASDKYMLAFTDGSQLTVDKDTECVLKSSDALSGIRIEIITGRLFADVEKREDTPFTITGSAEVSVMGTVFGVQEKSGKTRVDVLEGKVKVTGGEKEILLSRGESGTGSSAEVNTTDDNPHTGTAWVRDWIVFENKPLAEVLSWIEENSAYRFADPDGQVEGHTVSIAIEDESFEQIIDSLMLSCMLKYKIDKYDIHIDS